MSFDYSCINKLSANKLFQNTEHMNRFSDLVTCYGNYPFFTRGLVKCMYLSSWDDEHYAVILDILNDMTLERSKNTYAMEDNGKSLEAESTGRDHEIFCLSSSFLSGIPYEVNYDNLDDDGRFIIEQALLAADIIDKSFGDED